MTAEAKFRGVLELAPDAIVIVDQAGQIVLINAQMERLFGYARDEILGASIDKLVPEWFRDWHPATRADFVGDRSSARWAAAWICTACARMAASFRWRSA
jgi:PAS domain S-box-containing protein